MSKTKTGKKLKIDRDAAYVLRTDARTVSFKAMPRSDADIPRIADVLMRTFDRVPSLLSLERGGFDKGGIWQTDRVIDRFQPVLSGTAFYQADADWYARWIVTRLPEYEKTPLWRRLFGRKKRRP